MELFELDLLIESINNNTNIEQLQTLKESAKQNIEYHEIRDETIKVSEFIDIQTIIDNRLKLLNS